MKQTVVIGISSGIAAYKVLDLIHSLRDKNIPVQVVMTEHATKMVSVAEIAGASGNQPLRSLYAPDFDPKQVLQTKVVDHIALADSAAVFVVAPATANTISKLAHGLADDVLTTTALAVTAPIIICPSMNVNMWNNPAVQANLRLLHERGMIIIEPDSGELACGYTGKGRLPPTEVIDAEIQKQLHRSARLAGKKVLVTTGGSSEPIDDVRTLTNRSSGKMGCAIADAAYLAGADVTLLHSESSVLPRYHMNLQSFTSAQDLFESMKPLLPETDILFHVAAVADFKVDTKNGKLDSSVPQVIELTPQPKILDQIKKLDPKIQLIAFKAEAGLSEADLIKKAEQRLKSSGADAIIANDVTPARDRGFQADANEVIIITKNRDPYKIPLASKISIAEKILDYLF